MEVKRKGKGTLLLLSLLLLLIILLLLLLLIFFCTMLTCYDSIFHQLISRISCQKYKAEMFCIYYIQTDTYGALQYAYLVLSANANSTQVIAVTKHYCINDRH